MNILRDMGLTGGDGVNLDGRQVINVTASLTEPDPQNVGDVWIETDKDINDVVIRTEEPASGTTGQAYLSTINTEMVLNVEKGAEFMGVSMAEERFAFPDMTTVEEPNANNIKIWENPYISIYGTLDRARVWNETSGEWVAVEAHMWNGSEWETFASLDLINNLATVWTSHIGVPSGGFELVHNKYNYDRGEPAIAVLKDFVMIGWTTSTQRPRVHGFDRETGESIGYSTLYNEVRPSFHLTGGYYDGSYYAYFAKHDKIYVFIDPIDHTDWERRKTSSSLSSFDDGVRNIKWMPEYGWLYVSFDALGTSDVILDMYDLSLIGSLSTLTEHDMRGHSTAMGYSAQKDLLVVKTHDTEYVLDLSTGTPQLISESSHITSGTVNGSDRYGVVHVYDHENLVHIYNMRENPPTVYGFTINDGTLERIEDKRNWGVGIPNNMYLNKEPSGSELITVLNPSSRKFDTDLNRLMNEPSDLSTGSRDFHIIGNELYAFDKDGNVLKGVLE